MVGNAKACGGKGGDISASLSDAVMFLVSHFSFPADKIFTLRRRFGQLRNGAAQGILPTSGSFVA